MFSSGPSLAISSMLTSSLLYLLGDTVVKLATGTLPVGQIIAVRGLLTSIFVALAALAAGIIKLWPLIFTPKVLLRGAIDGAATLFFTNALVHMRIADATAVINAAPIVATIAATLLLKERVSVARWMATIAGFVGVLLVLRPDVAGTNQYGLLAVGAMVMVAAREVVTRGLAREIPSLLVTLCSTLTVAIVGGVFSMFQEKWVTMGLYEVGILNLSSVFLFGAYFLSVVALRHGEVSLVGPFRYAVIVWSLLVGFLIWGDIPDFVALTGMALIAAAGLLIIRSEFRQRRQG